MTPIDENPHPASDTILASEGKDISVDDVEEFARRLLDPARTRPVVALTTGFGTVAPHIDVTSLASAIGDRAEITVLQTGDVTWALSARLPKRLDVYGGAARIWWPGLSTESDPFDHPVLFPSPGRDTATMIRRIVSALDAGAPLEARASRPEVSSTKEAATRHAAASAPVASSTSGRADAGRDGGALRVVAEARVTGIDGRRILVEVDGRPGVVACADESLESLAARLKVGQRLAVSKYSGSSSGTLPAWSTQGLLKSTVAPAIPQPPAATRPPSSAPTKASSPEAPRTLLDARVTRIEGARIYLDVAGRSGFLAYADEKLANVAARLRSGDRLRVFAVGTEGGRYSIQGLGPASPAPRPAVHPAKTPARVATGGVVEGDVTSIDGAVIRIRAGGVTGVIRAADVPLDQLAADLRVGQKLRVRRLPDVVDGEAAFTVRGLLRDPWPRLAAAYAVDDVVRARIVRVVDTHIVVELLPEAEAVVPLPEVDWTWIRSPRELFHGGERVLVQLLKFDPEAQRCTASIKRAYGQEPRRAIAPGPGEAPFLADEDAADRGSYRDAEVAVLRDRTAQLDAELRSAVDDRADLMKRLREANDAAAQLRKDLRSAVDRARALEVRFQGELDPTTSEASFLTAIRVEYARRVDEADRQQYPLQRMRIGREFLARIADTGGVDIGKLVEVCAQVASGRAAQIGGRSLHELRDARVGGAYARVRAADGAKAWRCSLQDNTASARRLHYWVIGGSDGATIEFASVGLHDDYSIPE